MVCGTVVTLWSDLANNIENESTTPQLIWKSIKKDPGGFIIQNATVGPIGIEIKEGLVIRESAIVKNAVSEVTETVMAETDIVLSELSIVLEEGQIKIRNVSLAGKRIQ